MYMTFDIEDEKTNVFGIDLDNVSLPILVENEQGIVGIIFERGSDNETDIYLFLRHLTWGGCLKRANLDYWRPLSPKKIVKLKNES